MPPSPPTKRLQLEAKFRRHVREEAERRIAELLGRPAPPPLASGGARPEPMERTVGNDATTGEPRRGPHTDPF